MKQISKRS